VKAAKRGQIGMRGLFMFKKSFMLKMFSFKKKNFSFKKNELVCVKLRRARMYLD